MKDIIVIGAGKIGGAIAWMLAATGDYRVTVADRSASQLDGIEVVVFDEAALCGT